MPQPLGFRYFKLLGFIVVVIGGVVLGSYLLPHNLTADIFQQGQDSSMAKIYLKIDGFTGDSLKADHKGEFEPVAAKWIGSGNQRTLVASLDLDESSPKFFQDAASGQNIKNATLSIVEDDGSVSEWKLTDNVIEIYNLDSDITPDNPTIESLEIIPKQIAFSRIAAPLQPVTHEAPPKSDTLKLK